MRRPWRFRFLNNKTRLLSIDYAERSGTVFAVTIETTILLKTPYHFTKDFELVGFRTCDGSDSRIHRRRGLTGSVVALGVIDHNIAHVLAYEHF